MSRFSRPALVVAGFGLGCLFGVGMLVGALAAQWGRSADAGIAFPIQELQATATHGSSKFAMATGPVAPDSEGVFFLDYLTGELQCWVLYPRNGQFGGKFVTNVVKDLSVVPGKAPDYVITTGITQFRGNVVSNCVVYVADANTGNFAAYSIPWNRQALTNNRPQGGPLQLISVGKARNLTVQE